MKSNHPLVSVAMATYNGERFLREQLDSIYNQTYKNIEVVVSDDFSTDRTVEILAEYHIKYNLRYYVNEQNLGLVKNFEKAISLCKGDLIALCDQDDIWKPEKIQILIQEIGDYTLIYSPTIEIINEASDLVHRHHNTHIYYTSCEENVTHKLIAYNWVVSHQVLFKKELIELALPIPTSQYYHDGWLAIVASKIKGIKFFDRSLIYYRQHKNSFTYQSKLTYDQSNLLFKIIKKIKIRQQSNAQKKDNFNSQIARLNDLSLCALMEEDDRQVITDLISYYRERLHPGLHWKSFILGIKYVNLFYYNISLWAKIKFILNSLIDVI